MNEEEILALFNSLIGDLADNMTGVMEDFRDNIVANAGRMNRSATESTASVQRNTDGFDSLNDSVHNVADELTFLEKLQQDASETYEGATKTVKQFGQAGASAIKSLAGAQSDSLDILQGFINPIQSGIETAFGAASTVITGITGGVGELLGAFGSIGGAIGDVISGLGDMFAGLTKVAGELIGGAVATGLQLTLEALTQAMDMFKASTGAGLFFTNGLVGMTEQLKDLALYSSEYSDLVQKSAQDLTIVSGSVSQGMKDLSGTMKFFDKNVNSSGRDLREELFNIGISYQEQAEGMADYMLMQKRAGQLDLTDKQALAIQSAEYMKNLKVISSLTGKSAEDMKKERDDAQRNIAFRNRMASMTDEQRAKTNAALAAVGEEGQQAMQEAIVMGKVLTDEGAIISGMSTHYENLAASIFDGSAGVKDVVSGFMESIKADTPRLQQVMKDFDVIGQASLLGIGGMEKFNSSLTGIWNAMDRARDFNAAAYNKLVNEGGTKDETQGIETIFALIRSTSNHFLATLTREGGGLINGLEKWFDEANAFISELFNTFDNAGKGEGFAAVWKLINGKVKEFFTDKGAPEKTWGTMIGDALAKIYEESGLASVLDPIIIKGEEFLDIGMAAFEQFKIMLTEIMDSAWYKTLFGVGGVTDKIANESSFGNDGKGVLDEMGGYQYAIPVVGEVVAATDAFSWAADKFSTAMETESTTGNLSELNKNFSEQIQTEKEKEVTRQANLASKGITSPALQAELGIGTGPELGSNIPGIPEPGSKAMTAEQARTTAATNKTNSLLQDLIGFASQW